MSPANEKSLSSMKTIGVKNPAIITDVLSL